MKSKLVAILLSIVLFVVSLTGCATSNVSDEKPIRIQIGHADSATRSMRLWTQLLSKYLEEHAPGKFSVEVYAASHLGNNVDLLEFLEEQRINMVFDVSSVITAATGPEAACIGLPYLYPTYEDWVESIFHNGGLELFQDGVDDYGYYCIDMYYGGMRQVISQTGIYHNLEDMHNQKIRISRNLLNIELWQAMGAYPAPMDWDDVINALGKGQIDALDNSLGVFNEFDLHEKAPFITMTNHAVAALPIICSTEWIESLEPELRAVLEEGIHEVAKQQRLEERKMEADYLEQFKSEGVTVEELTPQQVAENVNAVQPVYDIWRGIAGDEVVNDWLATIPKKE